MWLVRQSAVATVHPDVRWQVPVARSGFKRGRYSKTLRGFLFFAPHSNEQTPPTDEGQLREDCVSEQSNFAPEVTRTRAP